MRWTLILPTVALLAACGSDIEAWGTHSATKQQPIINGSLPISPQDDAVVALVYPGYGYFCSGTLITPTVVLTSAHCLESGIPIIGGAKIYFGHDVDVNGAGQTREIARASIHPQYATSESDYTIMYDIGLVEMGSAAPPDITPIPHLPASLGLTSADEGAAIRSVGFGATETGSSGTKLQLANTIDVVCTGPDSCMHESGGAVVARGLGYSEVVGGPCVGDSGGATLAVRNGQEYLVGITSYGDQDCAIFGVSVMVQSYASMIDDFIAGADYRQPSYAGSWNTPTCPDCTVGAACTSDDQCGSFGNCSPAPSSPGGYCFSFCERDADCPGDAVCADAPSSSYCLDGCLEDGDCRSGYSCQWFGLNSKICMPHDGGNGSSPIGGACAANGDCADGGYCYSEAAYGYTGGVCSKGCGSDNDCPANVSCLDNRCRSDCQYSDDCRQGYVCLSLPGRSDLGGCVISCVGDDDCSDGSAGGTCNVYGLCDDETPPRAGARPSDSTTTDSASTDGCAATTSSWFAVCVAMVFLRRRRNRLRSAHGHASQPPAEIDRFGNGKQRPTHQGRR